MTSHPRPHALFRQLLPQALCALAACFVVAAPAARAAAPKDVFPGAAYVTLQGDNAVENLATGKRFHDLTAAHYIAVSHDGKLLLVSSASLPEAWLVDARTGAKLGTFEVGPTPQGVAISPDGRWALAVGAGKGTVTVIDIRARKAVKTIRVGNTPHNIRFSADGKRAYVTLQGEGAVAVLDMRTLKKAGQFPVAGLAHPHNLDLSADGKTLWIRGFNGHVAAVDLKSHKVLAVIAVGAAHAGIDVVPGSKYVFTGGIGGQYVYVIDPRAFKVVKRIDVGLGPHGVRASRDGRWLYADTVIAGKVAVIDTRTLEVVRQVAVGKAPFWVAVTGND